jgi:hypothetical protein
MTRDYTQKKTLSLTHFPVFVTALVLGLLEAFTVPIVEYLPSSITGSKLSLMLALSAGIGGGLLLWISINLFIRLSKQITFHKQPIRSIDLFCPLVFITVFLIISFVLQDMLLPLVETDVIEHLIVSGITSFVVLLVWFLYHNVPLKCRFNTDKQTITLITWRIPLLGGVVFVFEFLFLTLFSSLLWLPLPKALTIILGSFGAGYGAGLITALLWNRVIKRSSQPITLIYTTKRN